MNLWAILTAIIGILSIVYAFGGIEAVVTLFAAWAVAGAFIFVLIIVPALITGGRGEGDDV